MALFQIFRGSENELNSIPLHTGYAYFCEDTGNFFIDVDTNPGGRVQVNAHYASALKNSSGAEIDIDKILLDDALIAIKNGGTGRNTLTVNALLVGDGINPVKMIAIENDQILVGDTVNGVRGVDGTGVLYKLAGVAPQFGTLPIELGGTNATTVIQARNNLNVYSKSEVEDQVDTATTKAYTVNLNTGGWLSQDDEFIYTYSNTSLKCGKNGNVPPIISYTSNLNEYSKIEKAEATAGTGIIFTIKEKPSENIGIVIIDVQ